MTRITDFSQTQTPLQAQIATLLGQAGPASQQVPGGDVRFAFKDVLLDVSGTGLTLVDGVLSGGIVTELHLVTAPLAPGDLGYGPSPADSFVFDPRIGSIEGLDLSAAAFNVLLGQAGQGQTGPVLQAMTGRGVSYQDSYFDNSAKGGRADDLFLDLSGSDSYRGGKGVDTLSYASSALDESIVSADGGRIGITADLILGTVSTCGYPPPLFLTETALLPMPREVTVQIDRVRNIENVTGSALDDTLLGDDKDNHLRGLDGDDHIRGRKGDDRLDGGDGDDRLLGNRGDDTIRSGDGRDILKGGMGADTFVFDLFEDGRNVIRDFDPLEDEIELSLLGFDLSIAQRGNDVVIRHTDDQPWIPVPEDELSSITIVLRDTHLDDLILGDNLSIFYAQY